jgi:dnd system-associated protein 4
MVTKSKWVYLYDDRYTEFRDELNALSLFDNLVELYIFCGSLGFSEEMSIEINKNGTELNKSLDVLKNNKSRIQSIALSDSQDSNILLEENIDECYKIFSGYVNGGLEYLQNLFEKEKLFSDEAKILGILNILDETALKTSSV